jgi:hypothetical protein
MYSMNIVSISSLNFTRSLFLSEREIRRRSPKSPFVLPTADYNPLFPVGPQGEIRKGRFW